MAKKKSTLPLSAATIAATALSGFAALQYEILLARRLYSFYGATSGVAAFVMAWFFVGLCIGSGALGPGADRSPNPWRRFGLIEFGIVMLVLPAVWLDALGWSLFKSLTSSLSGAWSDIAAFVGTGIVVVPPTVLMGATLPALAAASLDENARLGRHGAILYGINTLAGAGGAVWVSFVMLPKVGIYGSFFFALLPGLFAGIIALKKSAVSMPAREMSPSPSNSHATEQYEEEKEKIRLAPMIIAGISGFGILGVEVLLLTAFAQVFRNATFSMASIIAVVVMLLGVASLLAPRIAKSAVSLSIILSGAGLTVSMIPWLFLKKTAFLSQSAGLDESGMAHYAWTLVTTSIVSAGPFVAVAGLVFPLLFGEGEGKHKAKHWGHLLAANAMGAMAGGLAARWILVPWLGLWGAFGAIGILYACGAVVYFFFIEAGAKKRTRPAAWRRYAYAAPLIAAIFLSAFLIRSDLPILSVRQGDRLLAIAQKADGIVSVVKETDGNKTIRINNYYWLGGTLGADDIRRMGILPLLFHPAPKNIAHIGTGTGITAGAVLADPGVEQLVSLELSPTVIQMAKKHFEPYVNGLFTDPRARVVAADARSFLRASNASFDIVIGDLFTPWSTGVGASFSREHFQAVRGSLTAGGVFVQWLPAYQLDEPALKVIAATFAEVFPDAIAILCSHSPMAPRIGLVGIRDRNMDFETLMTRCDMAAIQQWTDDPSLIDPFSVASLIIGGAAQLGRNAKSINTLNNAWIEFNSPVADIAPDSVFLRGATLIQYIQKVTSAPEASRAAARFLTDGPPQLAHAPDAAFQFLKENFAAPAK